MLPTIPNPSEDVDHYRYKPVFVPGPNEDYGNSIPKAQNVNDASSMLVNRSQSDLMEQEAPSYFGTAGASVDFDPPSFFDVDALNSIPSQEVASERASRYDFALGQMSPGEDAIFNEIMTAGEDRTRAMASVKDRQALNQKRQQLAGAYISSMKGNVTAEKINELYALDQQQVEEAYANPNTYFERKLGKKAVELQSQDYLDSLNNDDTQTKRATEAFGQDIMTKNLLARKLFEDAQTAMKDRTWGDVAASFIPFHAWLTMSSAMKQDEGFLLGTKTRAQIENAWRMSPDEFEASQKEIIQELIKTDPAYGLQYASALLGYSASSEFMDNVWSTLDLTVFTPGSIAATYGLGSALAKTGVSSGLQYLANVKMINAVNAMKTMSKNMSGSSLDYMALLPQAKRAQQAAVESLRQKALRTGYQEDWKTIEGTVQDLFNPSRVMSGAKNLTAEEAARIEVSLLRSSSTALSELIYKPKTLARLSGKEQSVALSQAARYLDQMYSNTTIGSRVVRIAGANTEIDAADALTGTDYLAVHIGTKDLKGYATEATAKNAATKMGLKKYTIENIDGGNYIKFYHPVDETQSTLRAFRDPSNKYADKDHTSWLHGIMSRVRMRDSLVPEQLAEDFKVTQAATNAYFEKNRTQFAADFDGLPKKSRQDLDAFLERERDYRLQTGPTTDPNAVTRGRYSKTVGELQQNFEKEMGRHITPDEIRAYFSWKSWNDVDYAVRNLDLARDKARMGIQAVNLRARQPGSTDSAWSANLEGKVLLEFPWDRKGDAGILIWDAAEPWKMSKIRKSFVSNNKTADPTKPDRNFFTRDHIDDLVKNKGYRVIHLSPYSKQTLSDFLAGIGPGPGTSPVGSADSIPLHRQMVNALKEDDVYDTPIAQYKRETTRYENIRDTAPDTETGEFYYYMANRKDFREFMEAKGIPETRWGKTKAMLEWFTTGSGGFDAKKAGLKTANKTAAPHMQKIWQKFQHQALTENDFPDIAPKPTPAPVAADLPETITLSPKALSDFKAAVKALDATANVRYSKGKFTLSIGPKGSSRVVVNQGSMDDVVKYFEDAPDPKFEPPVEAGKVRVHHSGIAPDGSPRWVSTNRSRGRDYRENLPHWYTDLDANDSRVVNADYPDQSIAQGFEFSFELTPEEASGFKPATPKTGAAKSVATSGDFSVGDTVYPLGKDKSRLTSEPQKISAIYEDPKFGTYVQTEGQPSFVPLSQVEMVAKKPQPAEVTPLVTGGPETPTFNPDLYPEMKDPGKVDYIIVKQEEDMKTASMDLLSFPYQEGGHRLDMDSYFYIRQPQVYFHKNGQSLISTYEGDVNAFSAVLESDAKGFNDRLNQIRLMLADDLNNGTNNAEAYYIRNLDGASKDFKSFRDQFKEINESGALSLKHPFVVTPRNKGTWDYIRPDLKDNQGNLTYPNLENARDSEHNLFNNELNLKYALNRSDNLEKVVQKGTSDYPVFGTELQSNLSPMATLINSTSDLIRGRVIDDLKIKSAENFGKAYANVIDAAPELIRRDPMYYILNPQWKKGLMGDDLKLLNSAKDYRRALIDFLGVENTQREWIGHIQRTVADQIKSKLGQKSYDWVDRHMLRGKVVDPVRWANTQVFDLFFGFFNIKQLAVQAMTAVHPIAVSKHGLSSSVAAHAARWVLFDDNPARTLYLGRKLQAAKIMKADTFVEAVNSYKRSGWHLIGHETAMQDDFMNSQIKEGFMERMRNSARVFYKEGDRYARTTGYLTSFAEWRAINPLAKLTPAIESEILQRADDLTLNMTAASNSALAQGVGAIPMKFTTYYLRFMEQMLPGWTSSKLTPAERLRAYAIYSMLFGAPITAGGVTGVWPWYKEWAKEMNDAGYDAEESLVLKGFNEGAAGLLSELTGLNQNFSEALGPSGTSWLYDIYNGKSALFDIVTGVGGTKLEDTFEETWPFFTFISNVFRTDDEKYPLQLQDLELLVRSVSSVNNTWRAIQMYNTGVYMSKNRTPLAQGVDGVDAVMNMLFGTMPDKLSNAFIKADMTKATADMKKSATKDIQRYYRLYLKSLSEDDLEQATHYGKVIKYHIIANGFTPDEMNKLFTDSTTEAGDFVSRAERTFSGSTPERQKMYLDKIRKEQKVQQ